MSRGNPVEPLSAIDTSSQIDINQAAASLFPGIETGEFPEAEELTHGLIKDFFDKDTSNGVCQSAVRLSAASKFYDHYRLNSASLSSVEHSADVLDNARAVTLAEFGDEPDNLDRIIATSTIAQFTAALKPAARPE